MMKELTVNELFSGIGSQRAQLYKQAGNSIVVDVLYYIFANLLEVEDIAYSSNLILRGGN